MNSTGRILIAVLGLQTVLLVVLVANSLRASQPLASSGVTSLDRPMASDSGASPDIDMTLLVLSEQLGRIEARLDALETTDPVTRETTPAMPERQLSRSEISTYVGQVTAQIDRLSVQQQVSSTDLDTVMATIARMPPSARTAALAELNRAINSGRINGQF